MDDELKEQIKEYLKENLQIEIEHRESYYYNNKYYEVKLILDGETISESCT